MKLILPGILQNVCFQVPVFYPPHKVSYEFPYFLNQEIVSLILQRPTISFQHLWSCGHKQVLAGDLDLLRITQDKSRGLESPDSFI